MSELSIEQQAAVSSDSDQLLLVATAGSGKTRTLVARTQDVSIIGGVPAEKLIVITFTNAAARELLERSALSYGFCGTLHSFCLRMIQQYGHYIGFQPPLAVIDEIRAKELLEEAIKEVGYKGRKGDLKTALELGPYAELDGSPQMFAAMAYYHKLRDGGLLDMDSILHYGHRVIERMPECEFEFTHLFVDEYQDSAPMDALIYKAMPVESRFFVGDLDQSIFQFRGSTVKNIMQLVDDPETEVLTLEDCYRCDAVICRAAQTLIEHNTRRLPKNTISRTGLDGYYEVERFANARDEVVKIAREINMNGHATECAVLLRKNKLVDFFADALEGFGVPVQRKVNERVPEDWGDVRAYIALLCNPENDVLAMDYLRRTQGENAASIARMKALSEYSSINEAVLHIDYMEEPRPSEVVLGLAKGGYSPASVRRVEEALKNLPAGSTFLELVYALNADYGADSTEERGHGCVVTTIHKAKGREWDTVFLPAFEEGNCPFTSKSADIEDERCMAFVAITRARHRLFVSYCAQREDPWRHTMEDKVPSRFIGEAGL